jgi:hypothetical protein
VHFQIQTTIRTTAHSHDPNPDATAATNIRSVLKDIATTSRGTPVQILADHTATASLEVSMGVPDSVKGCIRREKAKVFPQSPASLPDLILPDE